MRQIEDIVYLHNKDRKKLFHKFFFNKTQNVIIFKNNVDLLLRIIDYFGSRIIFTLIGVQRQRFLSSISTANV